MTKNLLARIFILAFLVTMVGCGGKIITAEKIDDCNKSLNNCLERGKALTNDQALIEKVWTDCHMTYNSCMSCTVKQ